MKVLIIDDDANIGVTTRVAVRSMGHDCVAVQDPTTGLNRLIEEGFHVVFLDLKLSAGECGLDWISRLLESSPHVHIVIFTAHANVETAVKAIQQGASDYIEKPFTPDQIRATLTKIAKTLQLKKRVSDLEDKIRLDQYETSEMWHSNAPSMQAIYAIAQKVANSEANLLIEGESGTGKSLLAMQIHKESDRREERFVTLSCPSLTNELIASELFGHMKGSFTGAFKDRWGKVAAADGGTLFLDEVGDLPLDIQPKLLRLLQERKYERVGENQTRTANVRVIAATNRNLSEAVERNEFRDDLYYRLNVIPIHMPALRDRMEDFEFIAKSLLSRYSTENRKKVTDFTPRAWSWMQHYTWPGNIRELKNAVERAVILAENSVADLEEIVVCQAPHSKANDDQHTCRIGGTHTLEEIETAHIQATIKSTSTMEEAAHCLGIDPATLYRKRKRMDARLEAANSA